MRYLAMLLSLTLIGCQSVRDLPPEEQVVVAVHEVKLTKDQAFIKAVEWFATTFHDSKAVLEVQDKESGMIIGKGIIPDGVTVAGPIPMRNPVRMTIKLEIKDQKYRATFSDFTMIVDHSAYNPNGERDIQVGTELDTSKETAKRLDGELATFMGKASADF